jgi:hypothetical protein
MRIIACGTRDGLVSRRHANSTDRRKSFAAPLGDNYVTIEQTKVVDFVTLEHKTGDVLLTISDHLPWKSDTKEEGEHLWLLQEKINTCLAFIENGQLLERVPEARDRKLVINIVGKFPLSEKAKSFFKKTKALLEAAGYDLRFEHLHSK